jgi:gamma-glutamyl-gamma-aminobutyrate hydrolase PuuD
MTAARTRRRLVAVTGRQLPPGRVTSWVAGATALPRGYTDALDRAGGRPLVIPPPLGDIDPHIDASTALAPFDGLVLPGGADIDPARYGEDAHPAAYGINSAFDAFELALLDVALERQIPVLAICRGHQVLNVALGGTLDQHITDRPGLFVHGDPGRGPGGGVDHDVTIKAGTRLAQALGVTRCSVRSHHHQVVSELASKAEATAWSDDGLLEGFELEDGWVVAVQWHPEVTAADDPIQQRLFDAFVAECNA